jgi:hypothetical protein
MKINEKTRFPHPVLSASTGDYQVGEFTIKLTVAEVPDKAEVALDFEVALTQPDIRALVENGAASVGIFVNCRDTFYSRFVPLGLGGGRFAFERGALLGRVTVRPMIWTQKPMNGFSLQNCHPEFGSATIDFATGTVLALDDELVMHVGRDKLAQIETIFTIAKSEELASGTLDVFLESDKIRILVAADIYETVNRLRELPKGKPFMLNSVFLPAVMQVLDGMKGDTDAIEFRRWYRVFDAKCTHLAINKEAPNLWEDAQKLLQSPFKAIHSNREILDT